MIGCGVDPRATGRHFLTYPVGLRGVMLGLSAAGHAWNRFGASVRSWPVGGMSKPAV